MAGMHSLIFTTATGQGRRRCRRLLSPTTTTSILWWFFGMTLIWSLALEELSCVSRSTLSSCSGSVVVVVSAQSSLSLESTTTTTTTTTTPRHPPSSAPAGFGPIDETMVTCNMEDLEQANDSQLYTILHDLKQTPFFRTFRVDLSTKCPLRSWTLPGGHDDDHHDHHDNKNDHYSMPPTSNNNNDDQGEEFECPSAKLTDLDEDAEPLCMVQPEQDGDDDMDDDTSSPSFFSSNALFSLSKEGFQSKEQKQTYTWEKHSDEVVTPNELLRGASDSTSHTERMRTLGDTAAEAAGVLVSTKPSDCDQDQVPNLLPNDFWLDLCTRVRNDDPSVVNLLLNPERNTGYNGTHIWTAIYEENCRAVSPAADADVCLEERVLYRLLSGLHASTTLSIAKNYYPPSKRKGRLDWEPNTEFFMNKFGPHPDHVRNLHFSYVVLLRALTKAADFLYHYEIRTGDVVGDETATVLLRRLLDSSILQSCSGVFSAFDESLMFASVQFDNDFSLQHSFKDVFFNISSILDCVQCQQCKLHGKMAMLGYGTALKILFTPPIMGRTGGDDKSKNELVYHDNFLSRNEIVALVNTLAKFSESIRHVRELTQLYLLSEQGQEQSASSSTMTSASATNPSLPPVIAATFPQSLEAAENAVLSVATVDIAVGAIAALGRQNLVAPDQEVQLIQMALARNPDLLILARHYSTDLTKLGELVLQYLEDEENEDDMSEDSRPDAIVIGSGLAGLAAALNILDRGGKVVILEKEHLLGGNSNKASSGINACCPDQAKNVSTTDVDDSDSYYDGDSIDIFRNDTARSAGTLARPDLIDVLVQNSGAAVNWLRDRVGVDLSLKAQLGGHSARRTHRPSNGMAGAEIIYGMQKAVKAYQASGQVQILTDCKVTSLIQQQNQNSKEDQSSVGRVVGVEYVSLDKDGNDNASESKQLYAENVILATGGFAADRSPGSYLAQYRPELLKMPTTAGAFSTGDGITLATALGARRLDMDKVQIHPTGWVDPAEPNKTSKILAAELMRGIGGILINDQGQRFCDELGTRAYVTDKMLSHNPEYAQSKQWNLEATIPTFSLVLSAAAAAEGQKHVDLYTHKGLLTKLEGVTALAKWMKLPKSVIVQTLQTYQDAAKAGIDEFGKTTFGGVPFAADLELQVFYAGTVTPVLHYCMGGISIDTQGHVLNEQGQVIPGLYAAGEVTGGVHGANRLAGNSLLECTVFGTIVGKGIPILPQSSSSRNKRRSSTMKSGVGSKGTPTTTQGLDTQELQQKQQQQQQRQRVITPSELAQHNSPEDCWVALHGTVYDLTSFAEEHPAGPESIHALAGQDGPQAFDAVHNANILEEVFQDIVGILGIDGNDDVNDSIEQSPSKNATETQPQQQRQQLQQEGDTNDDDKEMAANPNNNSKKGLLSLIGLTP